MLSWRHPKVALKGAAALVTIVYGSGAALTLGEVICAMRSTRSPAVARRSGGFFQRHKVTFKKTLWAAEQQRGHADAG